jgi:hypothetical protein
MLKTNCEGCIFKSYRTSCELEQEVFIDKIVDKEYQFTKGYCGLKRNKKWLNQQEKRDLDYLSTKIFDEEYSVSAIVLATDNNIDNLAKTIESLNHFKAFKSIFVSLYKADPACVKQAVELAMSLNVPWFVDNIQTDDKPHNLQIIDAVVPSIPANWFLSIVSGQYLNSYIFTEKTISTICGYFNEQDNIQLFCNKFAFMDLGGNMNFPFFDKIQQFEDWKQVCYKIS